MNRIRIWLGIPALLLLFISAQAQTRWPAESVRPGKVAHVDVLQALVDNAARTTLAKFADKKLSADQLSITLIDLRDPQHPLTASFRGNERVYPASVVKLFYLVAVHRWLEDKKIQETDELKRAVHDMIVDSSNEATQYVLDVLTQTTGGYELPPKEMADWQYRRNAVNRYYSALGFANINVNQKTFCEDAYGRERVSRGPFIGIALQGLTGAKLWSKAGWTSTTRHDAAYVELSNGTRFVLVTFTTDHANERDIIPTVARVVIDGLAAVK